MKYIFDSLCKICAVIFLAFLFCSFIFAIIMAISKATTADMSAIFTIVFVLMALRGIVLCFKVKDYEKNTRDS